MEDAFREDDPLIVMNQYLHTLLWKRVLVTYPHEHFVHLGRQGCVGVATALVGETRRTSMEKLARKVLVHEWTVSFYTMSRNVEPA